MKIERASFLEKGPPFKKKAVRGLKREGLAYEKKLADAIKDLAPRAIWRNPWFSYQKEGEDRLRYCSPDLMTMDLDGTVLIVEAKRTCLLSAYDKLLTLYLPVATLAFPEGATFKCAQAFKFLSKGTLLVHPVLPLSKLFDPSNPPMIGIHFLG